MQETKTTSNGYEISHPIEEMTAGEFKQKMVEGYGLDGQDPTTRIKQLKELSAAGIATMLADINMSIQGSQETLISPDGIKIGEQKTLPVESRYDVFTSLIEKIKSSSDDLNPARVADTLALGVVLLHPFHDGNGRTARLVGLLFREMYDSPHYQEYYDTAAGSRDKKREEGGIMIYGYTPQFKDGFDQSNPNQVLQYLDTLLTEEADGSFYSCYGDEAPLHAEKRNVISVGE